MQPRVLDATGIHAITQEEFSVIFRGRETQTGRRPSFLAWAIFYRDEFTARFRASTRTGNLPTKGIRRSINSVDHPTDIFPAVMNPG
jgi:hypothetical protein